MGKHIKNSVEPYVVDKGYYMGGEPETTKDGKGQLRESGRPLFDDAEVDENGRVISKKSIEDADYAMLKKENPNGIILVNAFLKDRETAREAVHTAYGKRAKTEVQAQQMIMEALMADSRLLVYYKEVEKQIQPAVEAVPEDMNTWTREQATRTLRMVINKAEQEMYQEDKPLTMSRANAIISAVRELNMLNGFITEKKQITQASISFSGDDHMLK